MECLKMSKVYCYLPQMYVDQIEEIKTAEKYDSQSQVLKELIELGLKARAIKNIGPINSDREDELRTKHSAYLLRLLSMTSEILRFVFDKNKTRGKQDNVDELLEQIKEKVDSYIDGHKIN